MAGEPIIRDVVIRVRTEYVGATGRPLNGPPSQIPSSGTPTGPGPAPGIPNRQDHTFQQLRIMSDIMREDLRLSRDRNRLLRESIVSLNNIGGRGNAGGSVNQQKQPGGPTQNPFGTGIPALDSLNKAGFQLFITTNSVRMIAGGIYGAMGMAGDAIAGRTGTFGGDLRSAFNIVGDDRGQNFRDNTVLKGMDSFNNRFTKPLLNAFGIDTSAFDTELNTPSRRQPTQAMVFSDAMKSLEELSKLEQLKNGKAIDAAQTELDLIKKRMDLAKEEFGLSTFDEQRTSLDLAKKIRDQGVGALSERELEFVRNRQGFRGAVEKFSQQNADASGFSEFASILGLIKEQTEATKKLNDLQIKVNIDGLEVTLEDAFQVMIDRFASVIVNQTSSSQGKLSAAIAKTRKVEASANPPGLQ